jgi:hemin uptake protein HemP
MNNSGFDKQGLQGRENQYVVSPGRRPGRIKVSSKDLLQGATQLIIEHNDCEYCLRVTSNDKLILTK